MLRKSQPVASITSADSMSEYGQLQGPTNRGLARFGRLSRSTLQVRISAADRLIATVGGTLSPKRPGAICQFRLTHPQCQSILTDMDIESLSMNLSSDDPGIGLRASLALHRLAERVEASHVASAREKGWSWQQIGDALGVTRQSVHAKYNKESS